MRSRLNEIIRLYKNIEPDKLIIDCKNKKRLVDAIESACLSKDDEGKKHSHQYRIPLATLNLWYNSVSKNEDLLSKVKHFDELYSILETSKISGIGDLTIYDTATRIGAFLGLEPDKIYLHAGTRIGAENILGRIKEKFILKSSLPQPFQQSGLSCWQLEDILCIFKDALDSSLTETTFKSKCLIVGKC